MARIRSAPVTAQELDTAKKSFIEMGLLKEVPDDKMLFTCITHILVRAQRIVEPFQTRMTLHQRPDGWRISEIESSEGHINWTLGKGRISATGRFEGGK